MHDRWATFDCYGTLIDWNGGIRRALARVFGEERADALLHRYHGLERELEADGSRSYAEVLTEAMRGLGAPPGEEEALARSLPTWQPFPEVPASLRELRQRGWLTPRPCSGSSRPSSTSASTTSASSGGAPTSSATRGRGSTTIASW